MSSAGTARITVVNHSAVDITRPAAEVWRDILETYVDGRKFSSQGHAIEPLTDDPAAFMGGYRMTLRDAVGTVVDDRVCRITERDDSAMRLSLCAEYFLPAGMNLVVNASYKATPTDNGARYSLDAYSMMDVAVPVTAADPSVQQVAEQFQSGSAGHLETFLHSVKARLESNSGSGAES
jgi:hypothetical protein